MSKTTTKFLTLVFLGLLSISVPFSHAQAEETTPKSHGGAHGILIQDAAQFLDGKIAEKADIERIQHQTFPCGSVSCDLRKHVCMRKEQENTNATSATELLGQMSWGNNAGGYGYMPGFMGIFKQYDYTCVKEAEQEKYTKAGWSVYKQKREEDQEVEKCYQALNSPSEQVKQYCIRAIGEKVEVKAADGDGDGCEVIPVRWYNNKKCTFCGLLGGAYKVADTITSTSRNKLAKSFAIIIALGMFLWIAMKTLAFVSSMTKQDAAKYITEMIKQSYKFMIAFFALMYYNDIFTYIILPLLDAGITFGYKFVEVMTIEARFEVDSMEALLAQTDLQSDYLRNKDNSYYVLTTYMQMENLAYNVNLQYALLQTIGGSLMCLGGNYMVGKLGFHLGLGLACVVYGLAFSAFGFFLCMAFVFYLFDAVVQLGIVGGLLPFLIASWPFKITSKYTSTGFKMLLNSIFTFMMIGVAVKIGMELIKAAVELNANPGTIGEDINSGTDLAALTKAIDEIDTKTLGRMVNVLSVGFTLFMFANIMGFLLISRMSELVNRFAGGGMKGAAPGLATVAASTVKGMATKLAAPTMDAVGKWAGDKAEKATRAVARAPISVPRGAAKFGAKAGRWIDKKTGHAISNKAKDIGKAIGNSTVAQKAKAVGRSIENSGAVQKTKAAARWSKKQADRLANSKFGQAVKDVHEDLTGKPSRKDQQQGVKDTQKMMGRKSDASLGGQQPKTDDLD